MSEVSPILVLQNKLIWKTADMAKVTIKFENATSLEEILHLIGTFSKIGLGKLSESTSCQRGNSGKILFDFEI